jgi:hypothetical protein
MCVRGVVWSVCACACVRASERGVRVRTACVRRAVCVHVRVRECVCNTSKKTNPEPKSVHTWWQW